MTDLDLPTEEVANIPRFIPAVLIGNDVNGQPPRDRKDAFFPVMGSVTFTGCSSKTSKVAGSAVTWLVKGQVNVFAILHLNSSRLRRILCPRYKQDVKDFKGTVLGQQNDRGGVVLQRKIQFSMGFLTYLDSVGLTLEVGRGTVAVAGTRISNIII